MILKRTFQYLPAQTLSPLLQLVTVLCWANLLPAAHIGISTLVVAAQELSFAIFFLWWSHFTLRFLPAIRMSSESELFLRTETFSVITMALIQSLIMTVVLSLYFGSAIDASGLAAATFYVSGRSAVNYFTERARSENSIMVYTGLQVGSPALGLLLSIIGIYYYSATATAVLAGSAIAQVVCVCLFIICSDFARVIGPPDIGTLCRASRFGVPVMAASLLSIVAINGPRFIVDGTLGLTVAGIFAVAYGFGLRVSSFASMLVTAGSYPLAVKAMETNGIDAAYKQMASNVILLVAILLPSGIGLLAVNETVVKILLPTDFYPIGITILPLAALTGMIRDLRSHTTNQIFLLRSRPTYGTAIALTDAVISIVLATIGVRIWGATGAVTGPFVACMTTLALSILTARLKFGFVFPWWQFLRIFVAAAIMGYAVFLLPAPDGIVTLSFRVFEGAVIYAVFMVLFFPSSALLGVSYICARLK